MRIDDTQRRLRCGGFGGFGGLFYAAIIIAVVTIYMQFQDTAYRGGVIGVAIWYAAGVIYFALYGRKTLVYSPEEDFAVKARAQAGIDKPA